MTNPAPGMDHDLYPYAALPARPKLRWPDGANLAFYVLLHLEYWELEPPEGSHRDNRFGSPRGDYFPDYKNFTQREYGNRIGIFRVLDLLDRYGLTATVAANAGACERYPQLVEECLKRGYEFAAHSDYQSRMITSELGDDAERAIIAESTEAITKAAGKHPAGWLGVDSGESTRTPQLLAEAGYDYLLDWPNDDQPYMMTTQPNLVAMPNQVEWDDVNALWIRHVPNPRYPGLISEAFRTLREEGAEAGRLFSLPLHPWVIGQPQRIRYLGEALEDICKLDGVWQTTAGEIARHYRGQI